MTRQQHNLLGFIREFQLQHNGLSPTVREMGAGIGLISASSICRLLNGLEKAGAIERDRGSGRHAIRSVRLVDQAADLTAVPSTVLLAECRRRGLEVAA